VSGTITRLVVTAASAASLALPAAAEAATVAVNQGQLTVATTGPARNVIDVNPAGLAYRVYDSFSEVTAGPGCVLLSMQEAVCGGMITRIRIKGGDGSDMLGVWDVRVPVVASGGDGDDLIETGRGGDEIDAGAGGDAVVAMQGNDMVTGGAGNDRLDGGDGGDAIDGQDGADVIDGGQGDDSNLSGGTGSDLIDGGQGDDALAGETGDDTLVAKQGSDAVSTGNGNDRVYEGRQPLRRFRCSQRRFGEVAAASVRCKRVQAGQASPTVWPPVQDPQRQGRASASGFFVIPRVPGNARTVSVDVTAKRARTARVCIRLRNRDFRLIHRFPAYVKIPLGTIRNPRPRRAAAFATGELKKRGCKARRF
jgi:Ca2+-binding RTX toxin-like protein